MNFKYAAYSYLDEYLRVDRQCMNMLRPGCSGDGALRALQEVASHYSVARTLRTIPETARLSTALRALNESVEPRSDEDAVEAVMCLTKKLALDYQQVRQPLSAASKFLWMRYQRPVVIYDARAREWLNERCEPNLEGNYALYIQVWRHQFSEHRSDVASAAESLCEIKEFTLAGDEAELRKIVQMDWFQERVFDHAMIA